MIGGKGENNTFLYFICLPFRSLCCIRNRHGAGTAGSAISRVAHQARGAGEGPAHAHALLLVDAEGVGLDGQLVLQPALGHYQQLQHVLRLPQPQLEGLQRVVDGEYLVHEPAARAEEAPFNSVVQHGCTYYVPGTAPGTGRLWKARLGRLSCQGRQGWKRYGSKGRTELPG